MNWDVKVTGKDRKDAMRLFKISMDSVEIRLKSAAEDAARAAKETAKEVKDAAKESHDKTPPVAPLAIPKGGFFPLKGLIMDLVEAVAAEDPKEDTFTVHSYGEQAPSGGGRVVVLVNAT